MLTIVYPVEKKQTMVIHCLECDGDLEQKLMISKLGDIDVWVCKSCERFYTKKELIKTILSP